MAEAPSVADFFARVVPWPRAGAPGVCNMHWSLVKYDHAMGGRPFSTLVDFMAYINVASNRPATVKDIYFCLSMQEKMGPTKNGYITALRNRDNVAGLKALWLDLDVKASAYQSTAEALDALFAFCQTTGYPKPTALVLSGSGGAHCYWISDRMLTVDEWRGYAEGLKTLGIERGLKADYGCTTDSVRVLRVPGTFNHKTTPPKPVKLAMLAPKDMNFETELGRFRATVAPSPPRKVKDDWDPINRAENWEAEDNPELLTEEYRLQIGTPKEYAPISPESVIEKCPMMAHAAATGGQDADQGLWMLQVLATTFCHNGREFAHRISKGHKGYLQAETDEMFERKEEEQDSRNMGWPACSTFENFGSKQCQFCPHKGKIKSPLNLGTPIKNEAEAPPFAVALPVANEAALSLMLPKGYLVEEKTGYIGTMVSKPLGGGSFGNEFVTLFRTRLRAPWRERDKGLHFEAQTERNEWRACFLANGDLQNEAAVIKSLNDQGGIRLDPDNKSHAVKFMTFWMEKLQTEQDALSAVAFGWSESDKSGLGWAYNGRIIRLDGKETKAGACDPVVKKAYTPCGDLKKWFEVLKLVTDQKRPGLEVIIATAFAAPLMRFTGQDGGTVCAYGTTGANKSTAAALGLAVWGHPIDSKEVATTSMKSLMQKMGIVHNLPLYWDDVSKPEQLQRAAEIASANTEGIEGGKLNTARQQQVRGTWQTLVQINSNNSLIDKIRQETRNNAAQASRVFEYFVPPYDENTPGRVGLEQAPALVSELRTNFGRIGEFYSVILGQSSTDLRTLVLDYEKKFAALVEAQPQERFWIAIVGTIITGAVLANKLGATFDLDAMQKFLYDAYLELRGRVYSGPVAKVDTDATDQALTGFIKLNSENTLRTKNVPGKGKPNAERVGYVKGPVRDVRINIGWALEPHLLRLSRDEFEKYLNDSHYSPAMIFRGLKTMYKMQATRGNLCAGVPHNGGLEDLVVLHVPVDHWLEEAMFAYTSTSELTHSDPTAATP